MEALEGEFTLGKQKVRRLKPKVNGLGYRNFIRLGSPGSSPEKEIKNRRETETTSNKQKNPSIQNKGQATLTPKQIGTHWMRKLQKA